MSKPTYCCKKCGSQLQLRFVVKFFAWSSVDPLYGEAFMDDPVIEHDNMDISEPVQIECTGPNCFATGEMTGWRFEDEGDYVRLVPISEEQ